MLHYIKKNVISNSCSKQTISKERHLSTKTPKSKVWITIFA